MNKADIGLIGLAVMGQNLALNLHDHGFKVAVYNRTPARTGEFLAGPAAGTGIRGVHSLTQLVADLKSPRIILLMVKAGQAVDMLIEQLTPLLSSGDIIVDGGNSHYHDTDRRMKELAKVGLRYLGLGISGGEEGARRGPSLMPGGDPSAWPVVQPMFEKIAAQINGVPCCRWMGEGGAGHFVKMAHNGIEYGDMQLIAEAYQLLGNGMGLQAADLAEIFQEWNKGVLESYLIEITGNIFATRDIDGQPLVDKILDVAAQKGTGNWAISGALDLGVPLTLIGEAVFARALSTRLEERLLASRRFGRSRKAFTGDRQQILRTIHDGLYAAKIISYAQGFMLLQSAAEKNGWSLKSWDVALTWRGGCIIRSSFLTHIARAFQENPFLKNLILDDFFAEALSQAEKNWRQVVIMGIEWEIPLPAFSSALAFFDGYRSKRLPANLLQAQRDYFGAHTYERLDRPRNSFFHTDWDRPEQA